MSPCCPLPAPTSSSRSWSAGWLPTGAPALNLSGLLPETSPIGALLAGMFGYRAQPTVLQLVGYFGYLVPVLALFLAGDRLRLFRRPRFA